jgi:uncharacterized alpha-E superfamily protein
MMLSRTADHLYWMARWMERAENLARMLDVHYRQSLLPHTAADVAREWKTTLSSLGVLEPYLARYGDIAPRSCFEFLGFDREHGTSIVSCLRQARENARAVRGTLTSEMWETLNATWLEVFGLEVSKVVEQGIGDFLEWVKYRAHLSRGVTLGTMLRDESYHFIRIGTFLECADGTVRMLLARTRPTTVTLHDDQMIPDLNGWTILLRSLSAFEVYRKVYRDAVTPRRVAELLILRDDLPRSLRRCMSNVYVHLKEVANDASAETERRAGEIDAQLHFGRLDDLMAAAGLRHFLDSFRGRLRDLGDRVSQDFLVPVEA